MIWQAEITQTAGLFGTGRFTVAPLTVVFPGLAPRSTMEGGASRDGRRAAGKPLTDGPYPAN